MSFQQLISPQTHFQQLTEPFELESGQMLLRVQIAYRTWGKLNARADNAVLICHALTEWADADDWWAPLFGVGKTFDPNTDFVICSNVLGSCYGTTGPISRNPQTGKPYGAEFPAITVRDMVRLQAKLLDALSVKQLKLVIGGSLGGMQVLEWALLYPDRARVIAPIATSGKHSAWCIGLSEAQRQAIYADPNWQGGYCLPDSPPSRGLAVARMMAMSTYRSWASFEEKFSRQQESESADQPYEIANYLHHQGQKLVERFDANTYITLTHAMDSHDIARDRGDYRAVLSRIEQPTLVVAIESDLLYPPVEQQELAALIPNAQLVWLRSPHGHDSFLVDADMDVLNDFIVTFRHQLGTHPLATYAHCG
jgi:homoserine O-acetyltransferase/O-succinyltransferase